MANTEKISQKISKPLKVLAIVLTVLQCFYVFCLINPFGLGDKLSPISLIPLAACELAESAATDLYVYLRYNKGWIKSHTKEEIIERYGQFDVMTSTTGYYITRKINSINFDAVKITFDQFENVTDVDLHAHGGYPGG